MNGFLRYAYIWIHWSIITTKTDEGSSSFWSNNERTRNSRCRGGVEVGVHPIEFSFGMMVQRVSNRTGTGLEKGWESRFIGDMDPC